MKILVTTSKVFFGLWVLFLYASTTAVAHPCSGKGTAVFFVNGLFNSRKMAQQNLDDFREATTSALSGAKGLKYDLAWVEGKSKPLQLAEAMMQRGVDDFQRYWLWLYGLEKAPGWFYDLVQKTAFDPKFLNDSVLPGFDEHLELYSKAILEGYNVLAVSHSVGSFYANAALRGLPGYIPDALQPSIEDRKKKNPFYPDFKELFSNVQIGTPVAETVNDSPWVSFKDDQVLNWLRRATKVLPGNIEASGVGPQDLRGHGLMPSYFRVGESRRAIVKHMQSAIERMRYPIPFFQNAGTVEYLSVKAGKTTPLLSASFWPAHDVEEITSVSERSASSADRYVQFAAKCYDLRLGTVDILAKTIVDHPAHKSFKVFAYVGAPQSSDKNLNAQTLSMTNRTEVSRWRLGKVQVSQGDKKDSIEVKVQYLDRPEALR